MTAKVAVLGCGPAGLSAAHAAHVAGCEIRVFSKKRKSEMYGAQYLHSPIPGMTSTAPRTVSVVLIGTHDEYRDRVYGEQAHTVPRVSTEDLPEPHDAWDIRSTYDNLWSAYRQDIVNMAIAGPSDIYPLLRTGGYDLVINTIPAPAICADSEHTFTGQDIWAIGDAPERGVHVEDLVEGMGPLKNEMLICNGNGIAPWYRAARVFGYSTVEFPLSAPPAVSQASRVRKPLETDCDCWADEKMLSVGRYGQWKKGVLVHHAYEEALDACLAL